MTKQLDRTFSIAPMMDWTDKHQRYFARLLTKRSLLYTEMVTTGAIIYGDEDRHLEYNEEEHPIALQLGGSDPKDLAKCTKIAKTRAYDEVNLNVGCPSDRVQNNMIGACLMGHKDLVASCISAMRESCDIPVTIKHRIGIDDFDSEEFLSDFVGTVAETGCSTFIVHARIAILDGLSPKENREIPPLKYDWVYRLKQHFPDLEIIINGGIKNLDEAENHLKNVDGVMLGREAYHNPWLLSEVDQRLYNTPSKVLKRHEVIEQMYPYIEQQLGHGQKLSYITRHILGLYHAQPGGKQFRRHISEEAHKLGADIEVLEKALSYVE
ncbi:tRNA dihydrouridine synthase DusA [Oleiphilus sp. HI0009]|nr:MULTISPECIES: tRNA dihydrouridine(20/20a) synthase DusA [unclassified Oleiphilus]KZX79266.1 tRNA dihydrouridine synthase DusA [Oleiphilus sp. HI0009]KZY69317.1 tRNA dihydrouridine synthase DusA [Oleiphilus sp. HI0067]KZY71839.1 tRNA dihydrouridine synthase DusA [Oleiphilus sp. HI0066]